MNTQDRDDNRGGVSPTVAFLTICGLVAIGLVGATVIILIKPDATATFTNTFVLIAGIAISFAGTVGIVAPIARKTSRVEKSVEAVRTQTNGTLTRLLERNRQLVEELNSNGIELPKEGK